MTKNFKIVCKYIKDLSIEIPNAETLLFSRENFKNYVLGMNIRNKSLNALNRDTLIELVRLNEKIKNDLKIKVIVYQSDGTHFSAGADIKEKQKKIN